MHVAGHSTVHHHILHISQESRDFYSALIPIRQKRALTLTHTHTEVLVLPIVIQKVLDMVRVALGTIPALGLLLSCQDQATLTKKSWLKPHAV